MKLCGLLAGHCKAQIITLAIIVAIAMAQGFEICSLALKNEQLRNRCEALELMKSAFEERQERSYQHSDEQFVQTLPWLEKKPLVDEKGVCNL